MPVIPNAIPMNSLRHALAGLLLFSLAACTDSAPLMPEPQQPASVFIPAMQCVVEVQAETMACTNPDPVRTQYAIAANRMVGGQDVYVKLANSGVSYNSGSQTFEINVTVQNLLQEPLGTTDGSTVSGVRIFFYSGPTGEGGTVTVQNPTGTAFFTEAEQPYFQYDQILEPYEISVSKPWRFNMPTSVTRFTFVVFVSAPQANESLPLLDRVWLGSTSTAWANASNWLNGVPDSASTVAVPPDSLTTGSFDPVLSASTQLTDLRVGGGSTLNLGGNTLSAWGNVDVTGTISNGTVWMRGSGAVLRGAIPWLTVNGTVSTQGTTKVTGAVKVVGGAAGNGSLTLSNYNPLTIVNPSTP